MEKTYLVIWFFFVSRENRRVIKRPSFSALAQCLRENLHLGISVECRNNVVSLVRIKER